MVLPIEQSSHFFKIVRMFYVRNLCLVFTLLLQIDINIVMISFPSFYSLASFAIGLLTVYLIWDLSKKYLFPFLRSYYHSILFATLFGFLDIVCRNVIQDVLKSQAASPHTLKTIGLVLNLLALPFMIISWYFFIAMARGLMGKKLPFSIKAGFFMLQGVMTVIFGFLIADYASRKIESFSDVSRTVLSVFNIISLLIIIGAILQIFFYLKDVDDKEMRKGARNFGIIYLLVYMAYRLRIDFLAHLAYTEYFYFILHFAVHLPPLLYIRRFLQVYYLNHPFRPVDQTDMNRILGKYKISEREQEIIFLLLKGKSNKDIAQELFISSHTVRNHLHNIFQKLKLKNRHQLSNFIFNSLASKRIEETTGS